MDIPFPVGLDLASFHLGEVISENLTVGEEAYDGGPYMGGMAGFLGFWAGERIQIATYEDLTVIGMTGATFWLDLENMPF
jgi:hypothetical protein